jgi:hypothetical protein
MRDSVHDGEDVLDPMIHFADQETLPFFVLLAFGDVAVRLKLAVVRGADNARLKSLKPEFELIRQVGPHTTNGWYLLAMSKLSGFRRRVLQRSSA